MQRLQRGEGAGDVRRRHRRAAEGREAIAGHRRIDADARGVEIDLRPAIAEVGELVLLAGRADGDGAGNAAGEADRVAKAFIAGSDCDGDAGGAQLVDHRLGEVVVAGGGRAAAAETHVGGSNRALAGLLQDKVERADLVRGKRGDAGGDAAAGRTGETTEHLHSDDVCIRRDAGEIRPFAGGDAGDVGAVLAAGRRAGRGGAGAGLRGLAVGTDAGRSVCGGGGGEARLGDDTAGEEGMRTVDTGVEDGDGLPCAAAAERPDLRPLDQRGGLRQRREGQLVFRPFGELRVGVHRAKLLGVHFGDDVREPRTEQHDFIGAGGGEGANGGGLRGGDGLRRDIVSEADNDANGACLLSFRGERGKLRLRLLRLRRRACRQLRLLCGRFRRRNGFLLLARSESAERDQRCCGNQTAVKHQSSPSPICSPSS